MKRALVTSLAVLCASVANSGLCSAAPVQQLVRLVSYSDDDLASPVQVAALHRRIEHAINEVCADPSGPSPAATIDPFCKADAWANVRAQMETTSASLHRKSQTAFLIQIAKAAGSLRPAR